MDLSQLLSDIDRALAARAELLPRLVAENTDCYRLFHGTVEGMPGLTVDRYGPQLIIQSFHEPLLPDQADAISAHVCQHLGTELYSCYNDRSGDFSRRADEGLNDTSERTDTCHEMGVAYQTRTKHQGQDPLLFLDLRAGRRFVLAESRGLSVLNLFSYTCGVGICAAKAGAREVLNVDFAASALDTGRANAGLNDLDAQAVGFLQSDYFPAARQLAGLPVSQRRGRQRQRGSHYPRLQPQQFDLVVLDPPRWAKSAFGTVDLIRDYPSVFKPALLATRSGGRMLCTNNVAKVPVGEWLDILRRCAAKAGRPIRDLQLLQPEADFPSFDGQHPLKMAVLEV